MTTTTPPTTGQPDPTITAALEEELAPGVTRRHATIASLHATIVQGGAATPEREAQRLAADMSRAADPAAWLDATTAKFLAELAEKGFGRRPGDVDEPTPTGFDERAWLGRDPLPDVPPSDDAPPPDAGGLPLDRIRHYKRLRELQAAADTEASTLRAEANALEAELVEVFAEQGLQKLSVDGKTIYLKRTTYAQRKTGVTADDVKAALRAAGQSDLVTETVNAQTLSAYVRDILDSDEGGELPEPLGEVLELGERYSLGVTAAGGSRTSKTRSK